MINMKIVEDEILPMGLDTEIIKGLDGKDGQDGYTPIKGVDYFDGEKGADGYTPKKGIDYFDGKDGKDGKDGLNGKDGINGTNGRDGKDGKDGLNGRDGIDGKDGKDGKDAEPYDDTEIKQEVSELSDSLNQFSEKKVGYSEVVGNQLLMYADETKSILLATLDLPSGGSVDDVQINGNSIVNDGVADIPFASNDNVGVVRTAYGSAFTVTPSNGIMRLSAPSSYGLAIWGNDLGLERTAFSAIDNRTALDLHPINTGRLNYALRKGLGDGKILESDPMSAEEQANAQKWLGADAEWKTIASMVIDEDSTSIKIDLPNILYGEYDFIIFGANFSAYPYIRMFLNGTTDVYPFYFRGYSSTNIRANMQGNMKIFDKYIKWQSVCSDEYNGAVGSRVYRNNDIIESISEFYLNGNGGKFPKNTIIILRAR